MADYLKLRLNDGTYEVMNGLKSSIGSLDSNKLIATNSNGVLDRSLLPIVDYDLLNSNEYNLLYDDFSNLNNWNQIGSINNSNNIVQLNATSSQLSSIELICDKTKSYTPLYSDNFIIELTCNKTNIDNSLLKISINPFGYIKINNSNIVNLKSSVNSAEENVTLTNFNYTNIYNIATHDFNEFTKIYNEAISQINLNEKLNEMIRSCS